MNECHCSCHINPHIMHCAPCCDGQCEYCGVFVYDMEKHIQERHPEQTVDVAQR